MQRGIRSSQRRRRGGVGTLEVILTLPVVLILLVATVEITTLILLQATITHAATVAAREAGKCPDIHVALNAAQTIVAANDITLGGADTRVTLENGLSLTDAVGDGSLDGVDLPANAIFSDEVRVTLCVRLTATPFRNRLISFGFNLAGYRLHASAVVKRQ